MGQVLHGSATTTEAVRRAIQLRQESVRALAKRYGVSPTTVQKWRKRSTTADAPMGPKEPRSTVLTPYVAAAGRLPLRPPAHDPAPHPIVAAPVPRTTWHQPPARDGRRQAEDEALCSLRHRLLPHRHRRRRWSEASSRRT